LKPDQVCERVDVTDPKSEGNFVVGKSVKLAFSTVGDDLFYLSAEPNTTTIDTVAFPAPTNASAGNVTTPAPTPVRAAVLAILSATPSSHVIEEITEGSGQYRVSFNDTLGGYLRVILPPSVSDADGTIDTGAETGTSLIDLKTLGIAQITRDFSQYTTFGVEHAASYSWRFRVGSYDTAKYLAWCGQATCGEGVPSLRLMSSMYCGDLTSSGIRCDVMITN